MVAVRQHLRPCEGLCRAAGFTWEMDGHEGSAPSPPVWKVLADGHHACVSQHLCPINWLAEPELGERRLESRAGIAPASWWPCASTFANRRLDCSANGIIRSDFNDQRRVKIFAELIWIAPLIRQYAG